MLTIAVIEDQPKDCETLNGFFDKLTKEEGKRFSLAFFHTGETFLDHFQKGQYDLILMDIELGQGINGLETSKRLRKIDDNVILIFMTNLAQYAIDGYQVNAFDYCVKPITYWDFKTRIKNALSRIEKKHKTKVLINAEGNKRVIEATNIYYIEVDNHLLIYHTSEGDFQSYGSLKEEAKEFAGLDFAKCNSCFLVNLAYVEKVDGFDATVAGKKLLISHPKRKEFLDALNKYLSQS
ncbi:MAG: LytTR family DNA-binding domain-containing protein [Bacilli bacterium]|jgi:DNA-binding LytR/AlgR family response regulator